MTNTVIQHSKTENWKRETAQKMVNIYSKIVRWNDVKTSFSAKVAKWRLQFTSRFRISAWTQLKITTKECKKGGLTLHFYGLGIKEPEEWMICWLALQEPSSGKQTFIHFCVLATRAEEKENLFFDSCSWKSICFANISDDKVTTIQMHH